MFIDVVPSGMFIDVVPNGHSESALLLLLRFRKGRNVHKRTIANLSQMPPPLIDGLRYARRRHGDGRPGSGARNSALPAARARGGGAEDDAQAGDPAPAGMNRLARAVSGLALLARWVTAPVPSSRRCAVWTRRPRPQASAKCSVSVRLRSARW
jgi:hypothetical protein